MGETAYVWVPDRTWVAEGEGRKCRQKLCPNAAVAYTHRHYGGRGMRRWHYCGDHLHGRIVRDGRVWIQVHPQSPVALEWLTARAAQHTQEEA